jgi:hypothetical protein
MSISRMATIAALMTATALSACGGGGGDSPAPAPTPPAAPGTGIFAVNYGGFSGIYTFLDGNRFSGVHFVTGSGLAGHPHAILSSTNSTTARDPIAWANFIDDANQVGAQETLGVFGRTFSGAGVTVSITGSMGGFAAIANRQMTYSDGSGKTLYDHPIALSVAAGGYTGYVRTAGISQPETTLTDMSITASGSFTATMPNCTYSGTLVQHGTTGIYDAQATASGSACTFSGTLSGIATPTAFNGSKASWALQLDTADNAQTAVFILDQS